MRGEALTFFHYFLILSPISLPLSSFLITSSSLQQSIVKKGCYFLRCWCWLFSSSSWYQNSLSLLNYSTPIGNQRWVISLTFIEMEMILLPLQHPAILVTGCKVWRSGKKWYEVVLFLLFDASFTSHTINLISLALLWPFINNTSFRGIGLRIHSTYFFRPSTERVAEFTRRHGKKNTQKITPANNVPTYIRNFN